MTADLNSGVVPPDAIRVVHDAGREPEHTLLYRFERLQRDAVRSGAGKVSRVQHPDE